MNFKRLFTVLAAVSVLFTACEQDEDLGRPAISVSPSELTFEQGEGSAALELKANRDWYVVSYPEWVGLDKTEGTASLKPQQINVTVNSNPEHDRTGSLVLSIGFAEKQTVVISQKGAKGEVKKGSGTKDDPYTVEGVIEYVKTLGADVVSPAEVYVAGKITRVEDNKGASTTYTDGGTFGNATFYISDSGAATSPEFYCYRILYLGNRKFKSGDTDVVAGDDVIVCGKVINYKGNTPETSQGTAFLYSLNGKTEGGEPSTVDGTPAGSGTQADPYNAAAAVQAVSKLTWTSNTEYDKTDKVYVKGKISRIADKGTYSESGTFGNASFYISEDGTQSGEFYVFRALYFGGEKYAAGQTDIKVGDEVVIYGALMNYRGNTPETVAGECWLYSLNGKTEGGSGGDTPSGGDTAAPKGSGTEADPYNPAAAAAAVSGLTWTSNTEYDKTDKVYVKGIISKIANNGTFSQSGDYGNASFYISEDGKQASEFYIFRTLYFGGEKYTAGQQDIKVGDEVIIYGALMNYKGNTPETVAGESWLYSLNGKTEGGDTPGGGDDGDALVFQFSDVSALNWPSKKEEATAASNQTYTLNGVSYEFSLSPNIYTSTYNGKSYLMLASKTQTGPVYLGLPVISGKKLVKVSITTSSGASKSACGVVTSDTSGTVVSGGEQKTLSSLDTEYSWTLSGTQAGTRYYYSSPSEKYNSQIVRLALTYSE